MVAGIDLSTDLKPTLAVGFFLGSHSLDSAFPGLTARGLAEGLRICERFRSSFCSFYFLDRIDSN
jgi:hypothetical protein